MNREARKERGDFLKVFLATLALFAVKLHLDIQRKSSI
jgi:hypothetical protein